VPFPLGEWPLDMTDEPSWTMAWRTGPTVVASVATKTTAITARAGRSQPIRLGGGLASACLGCAAVPAAVPAAASAVAAAGAGVGDSQARAGATSRSRTGTTTRVRTDVTSRSRAVVGQPSDHSRARPAGPANQRRNPDQAAVSASAAIVRYCSSR